MGGGGGGSIHLSGQWARSLDIKKQHVSKTVTPFYKGTLDKTTKHLNLARTTTRDNLPSHHTFCFHTTLSAFALCLHTTPCAFTPHSLLSLSAFTPHSLPSHHILCLHITFSAFTPHSLPSLLPSRHTIDLPTKPSTFYPVGSASLSHFCL